VNGDVFTYDFQQQDCLSENPEEPTSPRSESSSVTSNLPSPSVDAASLDAGSLDAPLATPPAVNRGLKPRRKMSDSAASSEPSPGLASPGLAAPPLVVGPMGPHKGPLKGPPKGPPNVDRKLKPRKHPDDIREYLFAGWEYYLRSVYSHAAAARVAVISAKNHKRQRRKRQSVTAEREKSQTPKVLTAILTLPNLT